MKNESSGVLLTDCRKSPCLTDTCEVPMNVWSAHLSPHEIAKLETIVIERPLSIVTAASYAILVW